MVISCLHSIITTLLYLYKRTERSSDYPGPRFGYFRHIATIYGTSHPEAPVGKVDVNKSGRLEHRRDCPVV